MYRVLLSRKAREFYQECEGTLAKRLNRCFEQLGINPHRHPNITALKGKLRGLYRFRVGEYRVLYEVEEKDKVVLVVSVHHRKDSYRRS